MNWILGDPETWPEEKLKYFFKPVGEGDFDWPYEQHACLVTPNGDIMCFDNGHYRSKIREKFLLNKDNFSRGVLYRINREDMTIEQRWQYGKELGEKFFSSYIGNVEFYNEGHYLVHSGGIQYYGEHASEKPAALMQGDPNVRAESITVEVLDNKVIMELKIEGNFYRAEKLSLYHDQENLPLGEGERVGEMGVTPEFDTLIPMEPSGEPLPYRYEASFTEEEDRFTFKAIFEGGQLVMLMLEKPNSDEQHGYFISTSKNKFTALCCGTFIEKDPRNITLSVNKAGLHGDFDVRVIVDDQKFETGIQDSLSVENGKAKSMKTYDLIIVGSGPAGMTASIYAARANLSVLMLDKLAPGGQIVNTNEIQNYTGMGTINGAELAIQMYQHTQELNVEFDYRTVEEVKEENGLKLVCCKEDGAVYAARAVILATGTRPRTLGVEK